MKKLFTALLLLVPFALSAQKVTFINASTSSFVYIMQFDKANNSYICGSVYGRVYINGTTKDYNDSHVWMVGKLNGDNNFDWLVEFKSLPRDFAIVNDIIYVLVQEEERGETTTTYSLVQYSYDLKGSLIEKETISSINGTLYDVFLDGRYSGGKLMTYATMEGDGTATYDNEKLSKKMYSLMVVKMYDVSGNEIWKYKMEAGVDNFTDHGIPVIRVDGNNYTYIACEYGAKADCGIKQLTTPVLFEDKKLPLYVEGMFLLKIDPKGVAVKCDQIGENSITIEDMFVDGKGNIYMSGYHKGNDKYAKTLKDGRNYLGAKLFGKTFEYSDAESKEAPNEHGFIVKADSNWQFIWNKNIKGSTNVRVSRMVDLGTKIAMSGSYSYALILNDQTYNAHAENKGFSEGFCVTITPDGVWGEVINFTGPETNLVTVHRDSDHNAVISGSSKEKYILVNGVQTDCTFYCYWGGSFICRPR